MKITMKNLLAKNRKAVITFLTLLPLIYLFWTVWYCQVDLPFEDQWDFVPLLEKSHESNVAFADLTAQHNEHRLFFPRIIMLGLAHLGQWNIAYELAMNLLLGIAIFTALVLLILHSKKELKSDELIWMIPIISLITFSLSQWENWLWGWQIQIFLCVLSIVTGIILLSSSRFQWWKLAVSIGCGIVAVFSFANGFLYLLIGAAILLFNPSFTNKKEKWLSLSAWIAVSLGIAAAYFYNYQSPPNTHSVLTALQNPGEYLGFVFKFIGSPMTAFNRNAFFLGIIAFIIYFILLWLLYKHKVSFKTVFPFLALSLYSIGSAFLTGLGRGGISSSAAMSSRYTSFSQFFWISLVFFVFILMAKSRECSTTGRGLKFQKYFFYFIFILVLFHSISVTIKSTELSIKHKEFLTDARKSILKPGKTDEHDILLKRLYPPGIRGVTDRLPVLKKLGISIYRQQK
jgi:hypothetical protein